MTNMTMDKGVTVSNMGVSNMGMAMPIDQPRMLPPQMGNNLGRDKVPWGQDVWNQIDQAVHNESQRTRIVRRFLPIHGPVSPGALTIPTDSVVSDGPTLAVQEATTIPLIELLVEFTLTLQQVHREEELKTAITLAMRAANLLAQAEDVVLFQGQPAIDGSQGGPQHPLFAQNMVRARSGPAGRGLLFAPEEAVQRGLIDNVARQVVQVPPLPQDPPHPQAIWGERTFGAVSEAYSILQSGQNLAQAHYGLYALSLHHQAYADTYAPLPTTLIMPADRISPLVTKGFYGSGTLLPQRGVLVSLGGNTMDLVVGMDTTTAFQQEDTEGRYRFRIYERFALRLKDPTGAIRLEFQLPAMGDAVPEAADAADGGNEPNHG
jgi:uncharacterized linocin/CFP29 family protein